MPDGGDDPRIIPARAGFTHAPLGQLRPHSDHPRSRGVYRWNVYDGGDADGSSPLARGLPQHVLSDRGHTGIIPARAGFTPVNSTRAPPTSDHPRSRGVYSASGEDGSRPRGSSPLARGLPRGDGRIPARPPDHPRSRGVYPNRFRTTWRAAGSSPLARGLPATSPGQKIRYGIIPARAGFTLLRHLDAGYGGDHPRSRGVYLDEDGVISDLPGSSPLARGLRASRLRDALTARIIPARAGFTRACLRRSSCRRDHPRSRGVYSQPWPRRARPWGSSPLARGLRARLRDPVPGPGIIPARAGFTGGRGPGGRWRRDHPRSRGVYVKRCDVAGLALGSSPLARGLLHAEVWTEDGRGIIPARAGFTPAPVVVVCATTDHPRSRGVYPPGPAAPPAAHGSSPLARGLRTGPTGSSTTSADHPRSRGVYCVALGLDPEDVGSSPLARGLLPNAHHHLRAAGIIPARAGFTPSPPVTCTPLVDHPRSRGVYPLMIRILRPATGSSPLARGLP